MVRLRSRKGKLLNQIHTVSYRQSWSQNQSSFSFVFGFVSVVYQILTGFFFPALLLSFPLALQWQFLLLGLGYVCSFSLVCIFSSPPLAGLLLVLSHSFALDPIALPIINGYPSQTRKHQLEWRLGAKAILSVLAATAQGPALPDLHTGPAGEDVLWVVYLGEHWDPVYLHP